MKRAPPIRLRARSANEARDDLVRDLLKAGPRLPKKANQWAANGPELAAYRAKIKAHQRGLLERVNKHFGLEDDAAAADIGGYSKKLASALLKLWPAFREELETRGRPKWSRKALRTVAARERLGLLPEDAMIDDQIRTKLHDELASAGINPETLARASRRERSVRPGRK